MVSHAKYAGLREPSFPRKRESRLPVWPMDARFRGHDDGFFHAAIAETLPFGNLSAGLTLALV